MATLTKGKTFTNGELVTPANLHQMVDAATVANIVNADIAANAAIADTKLAQIATAGKVAQSAVTNLTTDLAGKAASIHQHAIADTTGLQTALDGKAASSHTHTIANVTGLQTALDGKQASGSYAAATHTHDDRYYTESEIDTKLLGLPVSGHTHSAADITSGTLANARTTATSDFAANAIVARDSGGNFSAGIIQASHVNAISMQAFAIGENSEAGSGFVTNSSQGHFLKINCGRNSASPGAELVRFAKVNASGVSTILGNITTVGSPLNSVAYNTTSDYRLKTNLEPLDMAVARLRQIPVHRFHFIGSEAGQKVDGFLAHEAQAVVPEAVTGTKDAVDADGKPIYQGIDQSKLVPLLVAAVQELAARVAALEAK